MAKRQMNENSLKNLRPHHFTPEESAKGGRQHGVNNRKRKDLAQGINDWLNETISTDNDGREFTGTDLMIKIAVEEMVKGNPKFWELLRDTSGQKPVDKVAVAEVDQSIINDIEKLMDDVGQ